MNRVLVSNLQSRGRLRELAVRRLVGRVLADQRVAGAEVSVALVDDRAIRRLNRRYLGKDRATDVIAFRAADSRARGGQPHVFGDVVVSVETAQRVARALGINWQEELCRYLIHGLLHLLGWEDISKQGFSRMQRFQEELLRHYASPLSR